MTDPRVVRTRATVLAATRDLLAEGGVGALCIDGVARRSGVARTTIYRHWPSTAALVHDALADLAGPMVEVDPGDLRDGLVAHLLRLRTGLEQGEWGRLLPQVLAAARHDPELAELQRRFAASRRRPAIEALEAAIARGELPEGTDVHALVDRMVGPLFYRCLVRLEPTSDEEVRASVELALAAAAAGVSAR